MRLGIDLGTTRTVVAVSDRGNYPILGFHDHLGDSVDWFPSVVAEKNGELRFGFDALAAAEDGFTLVRSFKRFLSAPDATPDMLVQIGGTRLPVMDVLVGFLRALRTAIAERSNLERRPDPDTIPSAVVAVPANAHGAQRFLTLEAFRRAGYDVLAMLNEPSAAGFEYTHRYRETMTARREHIVVYDLGGGTFDVSLVRMSDKHHDSIATAGLNRLGGDDFDRVLHDLVAAQLGAAPAGLLDRCREAKERLNPSSRRVVVETDAGEIAIPVATYYEACEPLIQQTLATMAPVMAREEDIAGLYVVGGASALPAVARALRDAYGRRVHRSPYPFAAVAIGLAIAAEEHSGYELTDRFSRHFGVFREAAAGRAIAFDPIFARDSELTDRVRTRVYRAAHNVGHFRFVECSTISAEGGPDGDITPFGEVIFPFDATLRAGAVDVPVARLPDDGPLIEEQYAVDAHGIVHVTITDLDAGYRREYRLS